MTAQSFRPDAPNPSTGCRSCELGSAYSRYYAQLISDTSGGFFIPYECEDTKGVWHMTNVESVEPRS
jgi:hypothetical protein